MKMNRTILLGIATALLCSSAFAAPKSCYVLLSNDDGIDSAGIYAMHRELSRICDVLVVAPSSNQSGASQSVGAIADGVRVVPISEDSGFSGYAVDATPAIAVSLGILALSGDRQFDLVVSGINRGENAGVTNLYSGTVGAAMEALVQGVPAVAVSQLSRPDPNFEFGAEVAAGIISEVLQRGLPTGVMLNINIPADGPVEGVQLAASMTSVPIDISYIGEPAPDGQALVYRPKFDFESFKPEADVAVLYDNKVVITPLVMDRTAHAALKTLQLWSFSLPDED